jgi:hypothetical protein
MGYDSYEHLPPSELSETVIMMTIKDATKSADH